MGNTEVKHNDEYAQELKELIERNKRNIIKDMREIVSINLSVQIVNHLYDAFMSSHAYSYKAITKYNIPYAMLYFQQSVSLYGQYVVSSAFGDEVSKQINKNSRYFEVKATGEIVKKVSGYRTINLMLSHFKVKGIESTVIVEIYETLDDNHIYTVFKEQINLKSYVYS